MKTIEDKLNDFVDRMRSAASLNNDDFELKIDFHTRARNSHFSVYVEETADGHCVSSGEGKTMEEALFNLGSNFAEDLKSWGYKE